MKNISIDFSQIIDNLIIQGLLSKVDYVKSSVEYVNKTKTCYNLSINQ